MKLKALIGSGGKMWRLTMPFMIVGLVLNFMFPAVFVVGGPSPALRWISIILLVVGVTIWLWSVGLVVAKVPRGKLITTGPYSVVKHPIYASVSLLVVPSGCFLFNSWLGVLVGAVLYISSRIYAPEEEALLSKTFGPAWDEYTRKVKIPWL